MLNKLVRKPMATATPDTNNGKASLMLVINESTVPP